MSDVEKAVKIIQETVPGFEPRVAVLLGSGLNAVADLLHEEASISYSDLPGFPKPTVAGHEGTMRLGNVGGVATIFLSGRQHHYEGQGMDGMKTMIRTLKALDVGLLILTNAAGSLRTDFDVGSVVVISDHINLMGTNPLIGANDDEWGPRFFSMSDAWSTDFREQLTEIISEEDIPGGSGVYAAFAGPNFETPAEVKMAATMGADLVGMSTVPENLIAAHCGLKCVGISGITNLAEGLGEEELSHDHTLVGAKKAAGNMADLLRSFIRKIGLKLELANAIRH